jgi:hypothetical protein
MTRLIVLSLGAGVQSTTLALTAARGEINPMPDAAIFADTGWEPPAVYRHLDWLERQLPFPVRRVSGGNIREDLLRNAAGLTIGKRSATPPLFVRGKDREAMLFRQCTSAYKVEPINRELLAMLGHVKGRRHPQSVSVELWLGISLDEAHRMKPSPERWIERRWPLIDRRMARVDCLAWLGRNGYPIPQKSACIGCPYHSDEQWRDIKRDTVAWEDAVSVDRAIRDGLRGTDGPLYLHRSLKPLDEADLSTWQERGQRDLFGDECEGLCGV